MCFLNNLDYIRFRNLDTVLELDQSIFYPGIVQAELSSISLNLLILPADSFYNSLSFFVLCYIVTDLVIDRFFRQVRIYSNIVNFYIVWFSFNQIRRGQCVEELFGIQQYSILVQQPFIRRIRRHTFGLPSQSIRFYIAFSVTVGNYEIELGEFLGLSSLAACQCTLRLEVFQTSIISQYLNRNTRALQLRSPVLKRFYDSK